MAAVRPHERIVDTAMRLFDQEGIAAVGVGRITSAAGVAQMTLYRHFGSKDELVAVALERWSTRWLHWLESTIDGPDDDPRARLAALWDALAKWFESEGYHGSFVANAATELRSQPGHPAHQVVADHRTALRHLLEQLAKLAGADDPAGLATQLHLLVEGATALSLVDDRLAVVDAARTLAATAVSAGSA